jgi:SUMO ligase MMS21 Smc5/6 complex component
LHLEFKFYIVSGWCFVLIWHDSQCKNWLVIKNKFSRRSCCTQTLLISSHTRRTSHLTFLWFLQNWNQHQIELILAAQSKYLYMTQEVIKTRKQVKTKLRW